MSSTTYPLVQSGSWSAASGVANIHFGQSTYEVDEGRRRVTGSSGGSADSQHVYIHGLPVKEVMSPGYIRVDGGGSYGLGQSSSITPGLTVIAHDWVVRKTWPLVDVTGSDTSGTPPTTKQWVHRIPIVQLNVSATVKTSFNDYDTNSVTVTTILDQVGQLTGTAKLSNKSLRAIHEAGGNVPIQFQFAYSGGVTYDGSNFSDQFAWLFDPTSLAGGSLATDQPQRGSLTLDIDSGNNLTGDALAYDVVLRPNAQRGGDIPARCAFRFD